MSRRSSLLSRAPVSPTSLGAFEHLTGTERGKIMVIPADKERSTLGRTAENDIVLGSDAVSRCHAEIVVHGSGPAIRDLKSKNGVLVNGKRVREHRLAEGDIVQVGNFLLRFHETPPLEGALDGNGPSGIAVVPTPGGFNPIGLTPGLTRTVGLAQAMGQHKAAPTAQQSLPPGFFDETRSALSTAFQRPSPERSRFTTYSVAIAFVMAAGAIVVWKRGPSDMQTSSRLTAQRGIGGAEGRYEDRQPEERVGSRRGGEELLSPRAYEERRRAQAEAASGEYRSEESRYGSPRRTTRSEGSSLPERTGLTSDDIASMDDAQAMEVYIAEGRSYLERGDFENAAKAFQIALVIDPRNATAMKGIRAAEFRSRNLEDMNLDSVPTAVKPRRESPSRSGGGKASRDADREKRRRVNQLFEESRAALEAGRFSDAIARAEEIRGVELRGDTAYLNEAKQVIDTARERQKAEFDPFLERARGLASEGKTTESRELCEQMLQRDPGFRPARDCANGVKGGGDDGR